MQRSWTSLLRFFRSQSVCMSNFNKASISIDTANYQLAFQGSVFQSFGFGQGVRCLSSRADVLKNVHASVDETKKGSWTCPKCQFINSAHHQRCMGCPEPDSNSISRLPTFGFSLGADSQNVRKIGLPQSIVKFCVLRSPHIDKKSREQFEMRIKKLYMIVKTRPDDLQKKFFWLKRQRILGAQYEIVFSYKTRLPLKTGEQKCP